MEQKKARPDPTVEELRTYVRDLPRHLGVWRAGRNALGHLLFNSSLQRLIDLGAMQEAGEQAALFECLDTWRHATSALVEWNALWAGGDPRDPQPQDVAAAVRRAREWRVLETIHVGLATGDIVLEGSHGWDVRLANGRDHAVEVLDVVLQEVTVPSREQLTGPSIEPVIEWFSEHRGRRDLVHDVPTWIVAIMQRRAASSLRSRGLTLPADIDLGGVSLGAARECYAVLVAHTELAGLCTTMLGSPVTAVWHAEETQLTAALAALVNEAPARAFIELLSFRPGRSPVSAPLIPDQERIAIPAALISDVGFERTLLRAAAADPARGGKLGNVLGQRADRWAERLRTVPGVRVAEQLRVRSRSGETLGDLDVVVFDPADGLLMVFETKWPVDAHTLQESGKVALRISAGSDAGE